MTIFSANLCHFHPLLVHNDSYIIGDSATNIVSINLQGLVPKVCLFSKIEDSEDDVHETCSCQALSISQSLNLSLSLRDRDRADTIITFHHHPPTENFLST